MKGKRKWARVLGLAMAMVLAVPGSVTKTERAYGAEVWIDDDQDYIDVDMPENVSKAEYFYEGSGTEEDPYQISTAFQFLLMGALNEGSVNLSMGQIWDDSVVEVDYPNTYFRLENDIDISGEWGGVQEHTFNGIFDGNGHSITVGENDAGYDRIFNELGSDGIIRNLSVYGEISGMMEGYDGLVQTNYGIIENCVNHVVSHKIDTATTTVGICRENYGHIIRCTNEASLEGYYVAGIADSNHGIIEKCVNRGKLTATSRCGGIALSNSADLEVVGEIIQCQNNGEIIGGSELGSVGGIVIKNGGKIRECYNRGDVCGSSGDVGGSSESACATLGRTLVILILLCVRRGPS